MRTGTISLIVALLSCCAFAMAATAQSSRSIALRAAAGNSSGTFVPAESAAVFIGVREFAEATIPPVLFTVDDAVDLAYAVAFPHPTRLVDPDRIVLAISGEPKKGESQRKLKELCDAGAERRHATQSDIFTAVEQRAARVGPNGLLIIGIATHGYIDETDGQHYLLAEGSLIRFHETVIRTDRLLQLAARPNVLRSLVFLDACRTNVTPDPTRSLPEHEGASAERFKRAFAQVNGRVVLKAAVAGRSAFEDIPLQNGVFTKAVLDVLKCSTDGDEQGLVTVTKLASLVDQKVVAWLHEHGEPHISRAIDFDSGGAESMPLAQCRAAVIPPVQVIPALIENVLTAVEAEPVNVRPAENTFSVYNVANARLWSKEVKGLITATEIADLDGDGSKEVIVGVAGRGEDAGKILVFDPRGQLKWSA
ncbi:MAG: hypothetical protein QOF63_3113, partial [Thermoanaerobaculia bacterium]|nr:hypothetical protein [Thermoanaerobaculia bacterium]